MEDLEDHILEDLEDHFMEDLEDHIMEDLEDPIMEDPTMDTKGEKLNLKIQAMELSQQLLKHIKS
jgi:hypothetical protein